jgi:hypothetical protein
VEKSNLKSIYVEGLHPHLQSDVRLHITSKMNLEEVLHVVHTVGDSKRHALSLLPLALAKVRTPTGVKPLCVILRQRTPWRRQSSSRPNIRKFRTSERSCR